MGTGSNGQGSGGGNGGKGGNPQGNKPSRSGAQNTTTRKVSFCMDYNEEPAPAKTLRFIEKGFDLTPSHDMKTTIDKDVIGISKGSHLFSTSPVLRGGFSTR